MPTSDPAVVLLSGGLDSTTTLALAAVHHQELHTVNMFYGQKHRREIRAAELVAHHYGASYRLVNLSGLIPMAEDHPLTAGSVEMPDATYDELAESEGQSPTYVPYRNGIMLSVAAAHALDVGATTVWAGMHAEDAAGWAYPDCTPEFLGAMANAIYIGTYHKVRLITPLQWVNKTDVLQFAYTLGVPLELTWSCYTGDEKACGTCPTCRGRLHAFEELGQTDPIPYKED